MSGGYFEYAEWQLTEIADSIDRLVETNSIPDEYGYARNFAPDTLDHFREAAKTIRRAHAMAHEIDYLVCSDTGEDTFRERWTDIAGSGSDSEPNQP